MGELRKTSSWHPSFPCQVGEEGLLSQVDATYWEVCVLKLRG